MRAAAFAVIVLLAGCAPPEPTLTASPTAAPTPTSTSAPSSGCGSSLGPGVSPGCTPTPIPPEAYRALPGPGTELAPGHYVKVGFTPTVGFTVGEGWTTQQQTDGFFDIQDEPFSLDVVAIQFANVAGSLDAAVNQLMSQPNTRVVETDDSTIDGRVGVVAVIETSDPPDSQPPIFRPILTTAAGPLSIASGRRLWVSLLPVSTGVLAILVGDSIDEWDRTLELAEPVLESVIISN